MSTVRMKLRTFPSLQHVCHGTQLCMEVSVFMYLCMCREDVVYIRVHGMRQLYLKFPFARIGTVQGS